ncbi:MAG: SDR family oxidoreductase [Gammaproteobacteria bacterium]|nr:SDR family oxidoreductase [Gammaproteobacteria bacterium]
MRVLITGTDGYIGALVAPFLADRGHRVRGIDTGFYRDGWLSVDSGPSAVRPSVVSKDLRHIDPSDLVDCDAVVHLAELSDDPLCEIDPEVTFEINRAGSVALGELAREAGVRRFVYASSCSVYGISDQDLVTEESRAEPQTAYAKCKLLVERDLAALADDNFVPVFLRNATAYGASPRMRFDSVLNNLSGAAWTTGKITLVSDGMPWRPLVHVEDISQAIACALEAPDDAVRAEVFNVGQDDENYRIRDIAALVAEAFPGCDLTQGPTDPDQRSYRVSFRKIANALPEFKCRWTARKGIRQLRELFDRIGLDEEQFQFRAFTRVKALKHLQLTGQIDQRLFWI